MSSTGSNSHTTSQSRRRLSTYSRSSEVGSGDPRTSCGCRWNTGNQSSVTWILERSHRLHRSRKWARKKRGAQPDGCVKPGTQGGAHKQRRAPDRGARPKGCFTQKPDAPHENTWALKIRGAQPEGCVNHRNARNQKRAHDRGARPRWVLHPATRHAAQENVGTEKKRGAQPDGYVEPGIWGGAHNQRRAHDRGARPKGCFTKKPDAPHENKWALTRRGAQPEGCVNPRKPGGANNHKRAHGRGARPRQVLHPATRHAAQEKVGTRKKGVHNPTGASNPEHGAAPTTKGVRQTAEHDR